MSIQQHSFWGSPWAVAIIGGTVATIIGGVILVALTSGKTTSSSGPSSSPYSLKPGASTTTTTSTTPAATGIYHQGTLELAYNTCVDLDAPPSDPQWGEPSANPDGGGADLCSEYPDFAGVNSAALVTVNSGTDTTCQNATGWLANSYQGLNLSVGSFVCVHTNQGRYSLLRVTAINSADNSIVFSVKTFKKPGD
jgi:hypothetical protein